jgi:hypothetical protein
MRSPEFPDVAGRFETVDGKTAVQVRIRFTKVELRLAACAIGFLLVCFIGTLFSSRAESHGLAGLFTWIAIILSMFALMYSVVTIRILVVTFYSRKFLTGLLRAE